MGTLTVFNSISLDGYFTGAKGDLSWAHRQKPDKEWSAFIEGNARPGATLLFGRITYDMMAGYWPSPMAKRNDPALAEGMNALPKIVFSRSLGKDEVTWSNTRLVKRGPVAEARKLKASGTDLVVLGSGSIVAQLARSGLVDVYQFVVVPVVLGKGRTMFEGVRGNLDLKLVKSRAFRNGNLLLEYRP